jgi:hypothetical protein
MKKHKTEPMPLHMAIVMLLIGVLLGSIFTFGMQYWNAKTTRESCIVVKTQFVSYDEIWHTKPTISIVEIAIDCADGNRYFIDGVSIDDELRNKLSSISKGENITLLIHPNSDTIVDFSSSHGSLLTFDETINDLDGEATVFLFLGLFTYFCALVGLYYIVFHLVRKKKQKNL